MEMAAYGDLSDNEQILNFLKVFRPIECVWCDYVLAFQHKATGGFYCARQTEEGIRKHASCYLNALHPKMPLLQKSPGGMNKVPNPKSQTHPPKSSTDSFQAAWAITEQAISTERALSTASQNMANGVLVDDKDAAVPKGVTSMLRTTDITDAGSPKSSESVSDKSDLSLRPIGSVKAGSIISSSSSNSTGSAGGTSSAKSSLVKRYLWSNCSYSTNIASTSTVKVAFAWNATTYMLASKKDEKSLDSLQALIDKHVQEAKPTDAPPEVGEIVLGKYDGGYYRGKITNVKDDRCRVEFVDFGDAVSCNYSEVLPVNEEIMQHPLYGMTVHLEGLPSNPKDVKLTPELEHMMYSAVRVEFCSGKSVFPSLDLVGVELFDDEGVSLNEKLKNALWPADSTVPNADKTLGVARATATPAAHLWSQCKFSPKLTKQGAQVCIHHQYSVTTFHIVAEADEGPLNTFQEVVAHYVKNAKPLSRPPIRDQIVIGSYSDQYFRGRVEKVEGENATICFIDHGDKALCKVTELFPVDDTIMKYPIYGLMVQLNKVPDPPANFQLNKIEELQTLFEETLTLDLIKVSKDKLVIPEDGSYVFQTRLWDSSGDNCINEALTKAIRRSRT